MCRGWRQDNRSVSLNMFKAIADHHKYSIVPAPDIYPARAVIRDPNLSGFYLVRARGVGGISSSVLLRCVISSSLQDAQILELHDRVSRDVEIVPTVTKALIFLTSSHPLGFLTGFSMAH